MKASDTTVKRNANLDFLRMLSMIMVTVLHAMGKGGLLQPMGMDLPVNGWLAWALESFSIGAVNIFMLLSGYFLIQTQFRMHRLMEILFQVLFYTIVPFSVLWGLGRFSNEEIGIHSLLECYLPIHMDVYWFITAYVVLYLFLPVLSAGAKAISQKALRNTIFGLLIYECIFKSVLPVQLEIEDKGYSFLWYLIVFLIGAYVRLYGFRFLQKSWQGFLLFLAGSAGVFFEILFVNIIYTKSQHFSEMILVSLHYNHVFVILSAFGIFMAFLHMKPMGEGLGRIITMLSPMTLGVYLLQETPVLRFRWQDWFGLHGALSDTLPDFFLKVILAVLGMYLLGTGVDLIRILLFKVVQKPFEKKVGEE